MAIYYRILDIEIARKFSGLRNNVKRNNHVVLFGITIFVRIDMKIKNGRFSLSRHLLFGNWPSQCDSEIGTFETEWHFLKGGKIIKTSDS